MTKGPKSQPGSTSCFIYCVPAKTTWSNRSGVLGLDTATKISWYKVVVNQESSYFDKAVHYRYLCFVFVKLTVDFIALKNTIVMTSSTATKLLSHFFNNMFDQEAIFLSGCHRDKLV